MSGRAVVLALGALVASPAAAEPAVDGPRAFAAHCFRPTLTAETAVSRLGAPGVRVDFYDLRPFRPSNPISEPVGRPATPGTDRRCEVAFDGAHVEAGIAAVLRGLDREGIRTEAEVPAGFPAQSGAALVAARFLNPSRIAVVQVGTREGPNGVETYLNVERLEPLEAGQ